MCTEGGNSVPALRIYMYSGALAVALISMMRLSCQAHTSQSVIHLRKPYQKCNPKTGPMTNYQYSTVFTCYFLVENWPSIFLSLKLCGNIWHNNSLRYKQYDTVQYIEPIKRFQMGFQIILINESLQYLIFNYKL